MQYKKAKPGKTSASPDALSGVAMLDRKCGQDVELETTDFERLGVQPGKGLPHFKSCDWTDDLRRDAVRVQLDETSVEALAEGHYIGFVLAQGVTAEPPLVIVMLRVIV
jgi:hypothetical protein